MPDACIELKVPKALRDEVAHVFALTDGFCDKHLDGRVCRAVTACHLG